MQEVGWLEGIRKRRRRQFLAAGLAVAALMFGWLLISAVGWLAWTLLLHHTPPAKTFLALFEGTGAVLTGVAAPFVPLAPMRGRPPEVTAADEFFKGPQR